MTQTTTPQPIMSLAFKAGYDDGHLEGKKDVEEQLPYYDYNTQEGDAEYDAGFAMGYADGYSGVEPLAIDLTINELDNGDMEYFLTYENKTVKVS